jgi:hypothetical protein
MAPNASGRGRTPPKPPKNHHYRIGHVQRAIKRAFIISDGKPLTTTELARHVYRRIAFRPHHQAQIRQSARRWAVRIGTARARGAPVLWMPKPSLMRLIRSPAA